MGRHRRGDHYLAVQFAQMIGPSPSIFADFAADLSLGRAPPAIAKRQLVDIFFKVVEEAAEINRAGQKALSRSGAQLDAILKTREEHTGNLLDLMEEVGGIEGSRKTYRRNLMSQIMRASREKFLVCP